MGALRRWAAALGTARALGAVVVILALVWLGPWLSQRRGNAFDEAVLDRVHDAFPAALGPLLLTVYRLSGIHFTALLVLSVLVFLALRRLWPELVCFSIGTGGILLIVDRWLKPFFDRRRPGDSPLELTGWAFPSGHAAGAVVFFGLLCILLGAQYPRQRGRLTAACVLWVALVWLSTLYARAHWVTDIAAGAAVGWVWLSFCLAGYRAWQHRRLPFERS
jgi:undecaprenyl-diphosphatase